MSKEAVYEQYGQIPDGAEDAETMIDEYRFMADSSWRHGDGRSFGRDSARQKNRSDFVAVHQFWLRPGGRAEPDGLVVTWAGKTILEAPRPFPYEHGRLPFVPFNLLPALGGGPAGRTWVSDLIGMQRDYNDSRSREATIRRTLTPKILAARGQMDPNRITSRVEVLDYNPTGPVPQFLLPDGRWMNQFEQGMNRAETEMGDRAGVAEVSAGRAASSAPAASILALQEADETKLAVSAKELAASIEDLGWQILMLVKQFWTEERTVRTWSRDGALQVAHFSGSDLGQQLDVHVSTESALPRSKSARVQLAIDFFTQGIITDPRHFVRMLDLPGTDFIVETLNLDAKHAEREHGRLLAGETVEALDWHNHSVHIEKHNEFRKTEEYEKLPPEARAFFDGHVTAHEMVVQQLMMAALQGGVTPGLDLEAGEDSGPETTNPIGANGENINPITGAPQNPLEVAAGMAPSALQGSRVQAARGVIGGTGNPGVVPGQSLDVQAAREGN